MGRSRKRLTRRDLKEAYKEVRYELDDPPEVLGCFGVLAVVILIFVGIKGCL
jgi:hypothetical protein